MSEIHWMRKVASTGVGAALVHPWLGARICYRVRYHAPEEAPVLTLSRAQGLGALAQEGGVVALIWKREAGELALFVEVPSALDEPLRGMLPRLLPHAILEVVAAPPAVSPPFMGLYTSPLGGARRVDGKDPFDFANLASDAILKGDFELRLHMAQDGFRLLVQGIPDEEDAQMGFRPVLRQLMRVLSRLTRKVAAPEKAAATGSNDRMHLIRRREDRPGIPLCTWLLRRYPLFDPWPQARSGQMPVPNMRFPITSLPATMRLDSQISTVIPLPASYIFPMGEKVLFLGVSTADGRPIGLPLPSSCGDGHTSTGWGHHFLVVGEPSVERDRTLRMVVDQVVDCGGGLVFVNPGGSDARRIASQLPQEALSRRAWCDMDNPAGSLRLNLLSIPPLGGCDNLSAAEAGAVVCALQDIVPLLGEYLEQLGITGWAGAPGSNILLGWATVLLSAHHRARLGAIPGDRRRAPIPPCPDILTLYELLGQPEALSSLTARERDEWLRPDTSLKAALERGSAASRQ